LRHAVARALLAAEPELKELLRKNDFLTRDPRMKERKKAGLKGARKRFQWTSVNEMEPRAFQGAAFGYVKV